MSRTKGIEDMFVFSNLAMTLDGKIAPAARGLFLLGTPYDRQMMQKLRKRADAVLIGAGTLKSFRRSCRVKGAKNQPINVIVSSALEGVSPEWPFFQAPEVRRILFVCEKLSPARLKEFEKTSEVVRVRGGKGIASRWISELGSRGVRRLLVEGGGSVMWDFARESLIDEYNVTLTPRILGGKDSPTLVDGEGFDPETCLNLKLKSCRRVGDELYLVYRSQKKRSPSFGA